MKAFFVVLLEAAALACLSTSLRGEPEPQLREHVVPLGPPSTLRGSLHLEKAGRLALYWENGDFELWDTEQVCRLGPVSRLSRPVGSCIASPNEQAILTFDQMAEYPPMEGDLELRTREYTPVVHIWDVTSGARKHTVPIPARIEETWRNEWYGYWLDNSHALIVRVLRERKSRPPSKIRLIVVDAAAGGQVLKVSDYFESVGEGFTLSPDRKMALFRYANYLSRTKTHGQIGPSYANIYARTCVMDLDRLKVAASWREPGAPSGDTEVNALLAKWSPDSKNVITADNFWSGDRLSPRINIWDARSGRHVATLSGHTHFIVDLAHTSTGDRVLSASEDRTIRVWNTDTYRSATVLSGHTAGLNKVVVLPGDRFAVSAAEEPVAKVWDLGSGKLKFDLPGHDSSVREIEVVSDRVVRTLTLRGTTTTWDCSTGKRLHVIEKPPDYPRRFGKCKLVLDEGMLQMRRIDNVLRK